MSSWFDSVKSVAQNLVGSKNSQKIATAANTALTVLTKPIQSVTGRFEQAYKTTEKQGAVSLVTQGVTNTLLVTAPFSAGVKSAVGGVVSKLSPTTKIVGTLAGVVVIPYLAANPSKIPEPSGLAAAGADIPKQPSLQSGIDYIKAHPNVSIAALTASLVALGFGTIAVSNLISNYANTRAISENTQVTKDSYDAQLKSAMDAYNKSFNTNIPVPNIPPQVIVMNAPSPLLPAPTIAETPVSAVGVVTKKKKVTKKKAKKKKKVTKKKAKKKKVSKKKTIKRRKK